MRLNNVAAALAARKIAAVVAAFSCAGAASAMSLAPNFGTTGVGLEAGYGLTEYLGMRGSYGAANVSRTYTESDIRYDAKVKPSVGLLTADLHPFRGVFRLSAGLGYNNTRVEGTAEPVNSIVEINGRNYDTTQIGTVQAEMHFQKAVPYLGLGWGNAAKSSTGLFFSSDFGVLFSKATGSVSGTCSPSLSATLCTQLQNDLQAETTAFVQEAEKIKYYPVLRLGIGYRF
jgi:hypothetical protein